MSTHTDTRVAHRGARAALLCGPLLLLGADALAQDAAASGGFDAHGLHLAAFDGDPRDPLIVDRAGRVNQWEWFAGGLFEYADAPLVYTLSGTGEEEVVLDTLFALDASAGLAVHDHVRLDLALPLYFTSTGPDATSQGAGLGDIRLSAMGLILRPPEDGGFGLGLVPFLLVPVGDDTKFLGNGGLSGGAKAAATVEVSKLTVSADVGAQFNPAIDLENITNSDALVAGLGIGYLVNDTTGLSGEVFGSGPFEAASEPGTATKWEGVLSFRKRTEAGLHFAGGFATAISRGAGTPAFRIFLGGGWGKIGEAVKDTDLDGIIDKLDACPAEPETQNGWKDDDGCPDDLAHVKVVVVQGNNRIGGAAVELATPDGVQTFESEADPQPLTVMPGSDFSGTASYGACMTASGTLEDAPEGNSTLELKLARTREGTVRYEVKTDRNRPVGGVTVTYMGSDRDCYPAEPFALADDGTGSHKVGAGEFRVLVAAPEYGVWRGELAVEDGKKHLVEVTLKKARTRVEQKQIVILDKVFFEFNKAVIKPESFDLLNEVANVLMANPQIKLVEVAGHTDNKGNDQYNLDLSDARAKAVADYLVKQGVDASRLQARGYGETRPIDQNRTESGRAKNRRVEFNILETATVEEEE